MTGFVRWTSAFPLPVRILSTSLGSLSETRCCCNNRRRTASFISLLLGAAGDRLFLVNIYRYIIVISELALRQEYVLQHLIISSFNFFFLLVHVKPMVFWTEMFVHCCGKAVRVSVTSVVYAKNGDSFSFYWRHVLKLILSSFMKSKFGHHGSVSPPKPLNYGP